MAIIRLTQYGSRCDWLKDEKFLRDLEGDSVDTEILDEELRSLQDDEPTSCRGKTVKFLESNPFQVLLCVLVLVDAGVVLAEILLDLHAIRGQFRETETELLSALDFLKERYVDDLDGYDDIDAKYILELLRYKYPSNNNRTRAQSGHVKTRRRRHIGVGGASGGTLPARHSRLMEILAMADPGLFVDTRHTSNSAGQDLHTSGYSEAKTNAKHSSGASADASLLPGGTSRRKSDMVILSSSSSRKTSSPSSSSTSSSLSSSSSSSLLSSSQDSDPKSKSKAAILEDVKQAKAWMDNKHVRNTQGDKILRKYRDVYRAIASSSPASEGEEEEEEEVGEQREDLAVTRQDKRALRTKRTLSNRPVQDSSASVGTEEAPWTQDPDTYPFTPTDEMLSTYRYGGGGGGEGNETGPKRPSRPDKYEQTFAQKLLKIAHILHYCSIGILGIFVLQLLFKIYGMGKEFFKNKMEIFDAVIILASFALDLVFLEGIGAAQGEEAVALLISFLLWRLLRVINGIMVTAKKRQEFRIKLQKRARRRAEKRIENLEEDRGWKEKEIIALKQLCKEKGANEDDIAICRPKRRSVFHKMDTSTGLSAIASMSVGLSMSMSGGGMFGPMAHRPPASAPTTPQQPTRRPSFQDLVPIAAPVAGPSGVGQMIGKGFRRANFLTKSSETLSAGRPYLHSAAHPRPDRSPGPLTKSMGKFSMEKVLEEPSADENNLKDKIREEDYDASFGNLTVTSPHASGVSEASAAGATKENSVVSMDSSMISDADSCIDSSENLVEKPSNSTILPNGDPVDRRSSRDATPPIMKQVTFDLESDEDDVCVKAPGSGSTAAVAIDIRNGPVGMATGKGGKSKSKRGPDQVRWFRRRSHDVGELTKGKQNGANDPRRSSVEIPHQKSPREPRVVLTSMKKKSPTSPVATNHLTEREVTRL